MRRAYWCLLLLVALAVGLNAAPAEDLSGYTQAALFQEEEPERSGAPASGLEIYFFDLGRVDGILIRCDGEDFFIDVGFRADATPALSFMKGLGVTHLSGYICSHAHADHIEGGPPIIKALGADVIYAPRTACFRALEEYANSSEMAALNQCRTQVVEAGDTIQLGGATGYCLGPVNVISCRTGSQEENGNSMLLKLVYGERSFLFTGDATAEEITAAARKYPNMIKTEILKNPHHNGSLDRSVAKLISPKVTIFSTSNDHPPARKYISMLKDMGCRTYVTGSTHDGNIKLISDGQNVQLVRGYPLSALKLNPVSDMFPGQQLQLTGTIKPSDYTKKLDWLCWSSSDTGVVKAANGKLEAVAEGTATITVQDIAGRSSSVDVRVFSRAPVLNKSLLKMTVGDSAMLSYQISPSADGVTAKWVSSDESVAFVTDEGEVIAVGDGTVRVGVQLSNGALAACNVTVVETPVKRVTLSRNSLRLSVGETTTLTAELSPSDATNKRLEWASSNESVVTVDVFGNVTAVGEGKAKIGVRAASGKYDVCEVRVK